MLTGTGILKAFDFTGKELWSRDIQKDYGQFGLNWGYASSPLLFEDSLYVAGAARHEDRRSFLRPAHRQENRKDALASRTADGGPFASHRIPTRRRHCLRQGKTTEIVISGGDCVTGHDPATGKELWRANGLNPDNDPFHRIVGSPVIFADIIYAPSKYKPLLALKAGGRGDVTTSHLLWSTQQWTGCADAGH